MKSVQVADKSFIYGVAKGEALWWILLSTALFGQVREDVFDTGAQAVTMLHPVGRWRYFRSATSQT